jgi:hypothetical protein
MVPDVARDEVKSSDFDMIVLPGGLKGTQTLQQGPRVAQLLRSFRLGNGGRFMAHGGPATGEFNHKGGCMETKKLLATGLALAFLAGGVSLSTVSVAQADSKKSEASTEKKDIKQGDKPAEAAEGKKRGFKKGQKPTETMGTMGKEKTKDGSKP